MLLFEPVIREMVLALWAVSVFAGVVAVEFLATFCAGIDLSAESFGAAAFDVLHCPPMRRQHSIGEFGSVSGAVEAEDVRDLDHQRLSMTRLMASAPSCSDFTVRCV